MVVSVQVLDSFRCSSREEEFTMRLTLLTCSLVLSGCSGMRLPEVVYVDSERGSISTQPAPAVVSSGTSRSSVDLSPTTRPSIASALTEVKISGRFSGSAVRPMVGVCRLTGTVDFDRRVVDYITMLSARPGPELEQTTVPDVDGNFVLTGLDRGEESVALVFFAWDDFNGDRVYMGYRAGQLYEDLGQVYVYWRTPTDSGFGRDFRMNPTVLNQTNFRF